MPMPMPSPAITVAIGSEGSDSKEDESNAQHEDQKVSAKLRQSFSRRASEGTAAAGFTFNGNVEEKASDYQVASQVESEMQKRSWSPNRRKADQLIRNHRFDMVMGAVILFNMILMVVEANESAAYYPATHANQTIIWLNRVILMIYTIECGLRLYVLHWDYVKDKWNVLDLFVVATGWLDEVYTTLVNDASDLPVMSMLPMLRVLRILRLVRAIRLLRFHPELYVMVMGFFGAMRAMLWGFILILALIFFWSVVFVEVIHPISQDLKRTNPEALTDFCEKTFNSVFHAGWTLFQTLVAGDSWGQCTLPIINHASWTFFIFALSIVSVTLGMMNLILAVIVDHAQQAREGDKEDQLRRKKTMEADSLKEWERCLDQIDEDEDGKITYMEMMRGYEIPQVRDNLNLLGIAKDDLHNMFKLIDNDDSGDLDYKEFLSIFHKAQGQDLRIYLMMMQLQQHRTDARMRDLTDAVTELSRGSDVSKREEVRCTGPRKAENIDWRSAIEQNKVALFDVDFKPLSRSIEDQLTQLACSIEMHSIQLEKRLHCLEEQSPFVGDGSQSTAVSQASAKEAHGAYPGAREDLQVDSVDRKKPPSYVTTAGLVPAADAPGEAGAQPRRGADHQAAAITPSGSRGLRRQSSTALEEPVRISERSLL